MPRMRRHTPLREAPPLPASCPKCGSGDISGPHFSVARGESKSGRSPALVTRTWFCRRCWEPGKALFELDLGQPAPATGTGDVADLRRVVRVTHERRI